MRMILIVVVDLTFLIEREWRTWLFLRGQDCTRKFVAEGVFCFVLLLMPR